MALAPCYTTVDEKGYELVAHGTAAFPLACYHDNLGERDVPWHWHDELEAVVISEGYATVAAGNRTYTICPGEGFFVNAGILHGCWDIDRSHCRFHSLVFHPRLVGGNPDSIFFQTYLLPLMENPALESLHLLPGVPWQKEALEVIEAAWQSSVHEPTGYEFAVRAELSRLILLLWQHMPANHFVPKGKTSRDSQRIKVMLQFLHSHYGEEISTKQIAQAALISESECLRCFRTTIRTTPIQYLKQYRIQQAAHLLSGTRDRIADIATRCGFQDISYFTKTFRQIKGCVPSAYRKKESAEEKHETV